MGVGIKVKDVTVGKEYFLPWRRKRCIWKVTRVDEDKDIVYSFVGGRTVVGVELDEFVRFHNANQKKCLVRGK